MTAPDRFPREAGVPAAKDPAVAVSETAVASPAIAVTPAEPALDTRLAIRITGLPPGTLVNLDAHQLDGGGRSVVMARGDRPCRQSSQALSLRTRRGGFRAFFSMLLG
jgi:hypothetical protein